MRVGVYSPLPPQRSGISDYTVELLPHLARHAEVELIVDDGFRPDAGPLGGRPVHEARNLPRLLESGALDVVVYHLGNNVDYHAGIRRSALATPGVAVIHDVVLHHLVLGATLHRGDAAGYVAELRYCCGRTGEAAGLRAVDPGVPVDPWTFPLFERLVDRSLAVLVHNAFSRDRILASRATARVEIVPHHLSLDDFTSAPGAAGQSGAGGASDEGVAERRIEARRRLDIPDTALVFSSFGFITGAKLPFAVLDAFARVRREVPEARLILAGEISPYFDFDSGLDRRLLDGVTVTGRLDLEHFLWHMAACDVAVNLRWPTAGETSGTLIRLLGLGKPIVVTNAGAFAEIPDGCCAKVEHDATEAEHLYALLRRLAVDAPLRLRMGENARRYAVTHHAIERSAAGYAALLAEVVERKPQPFRALPPLAAGRAGDLRNDVLERVSAGLVDLGVGEEDEDILAAVAARAADVL